MFSKGISYLAIFLLISCNNSKRPNCTKLDFYEFSASHIQKYKTIGTTYFIDDTSKCIFIDSAEFTIIEFSFTALNPSMNTMQTGNCKYILKCNRISEIKLVDFSVQKTITEIPSNNFF